MDWIMYTIGVVAHLWAVIGLVGLAQALGTPQVLYLGSKVTLNGKFFVPWIAVIAFWMWFFVG